MADRLDRRGAVRTAKRLSTQLTADLVRSVLEDSTSRVVLITDSPHVAWVQSSLPALLGTAWGNVRVSRWGVQAAPVLVHPHGGGPRLPDADFMVITESRLAELVCLAPHVMPGPQRDVLQAAAQPDFEAAQWKVVGYDPEVDGVTVRNDDLPGRELTLAGGLALGLEVGSTLEGIGPGVELRFEPSSPSAMPVLAGINAPHGVPATHLEVVEIVDRSGTLIRFDIDGDGRADVEIDVLHDLRPVRPDASATLGHLVIAGGSHRWAYVSSTDNAAARMPQVVEVLSSSANGMIVAGHASHAASHGELLPPPGSPPVSLRAGDMVWAIDVSAEGESATWITLSTPLRTLDDGHDHPEQAAEADDNAR